MSCSDRYACSSHVGLLRYKYKTTFCKLELTTSVEGHGAHSLYKTARDRLPNVWSNQKDNAMIMLFACGLLIPEGYHLFSG